ncbi:uncharacterized protein [Montipora foliosa]|uniref:uncharacterized protein n=1 Tax=Montipora foliosa TaxID=591990 RepID=UPI0035F1F504
MPISVLAVEKFKAAKEKQWASRVKGAKKKEAKTTKEQDVLINIGLLEWKEKLCALKPLRGKKLALRISKTAKYSLLREKVEEKWRSFHSNLYDDELSYELLYEDEALFLPGSSELFSLQRYQEEVGKDFNKITLFLCSSDDYHRAEDKTECSGSDSATENSLGNDQGFPEFDSEIGDRCDNNPKVDRSVILQIEQDEQLARELQNQVNEENLLDYSSSANHPRSLNDLRSAENPSSLNDTSSVVKAVQERVNSSQKLFLVVRRGAPFFRLLTLWQREVNRNRE